MSYNLMKNDVNDGFPVTPVDVLHVAPSRLTKPRVHHASGQDPITT